MNDPPYIQPALSNRVVKEASDWLLRIDAAPDDPALRLAFERWLANDPRHGRAWTLAHHAARLSRHAAANGLPWESSTMPSQRERPLGRTQRAIAPHLRNRRTAIVGLAAAITAIVITPDAIMRMTASARSGTGETRKMRLADGSRIVLGADSAVSVRFDPRRREVALLRGEAWFDVAHENGRPFVVRGDDMAVTVTGTAFDVTMTPFSVSVGLARGAVHVTRSGAHPVDIAMTPGHRLTLDRASGSVSVTSVDGAEIGGWRSGRLAAHGMRLVDVVATLERYRAGRIVVHGARLEAMRVTGVYDLGDPDGSLAMLAAHSGARLRQMTSLLTILSSN